MKRSQDRQGSSTIREKVANVKTSPELPPLESVGEKMREITYENFLLCSTLAGRDQPDRGRPPVGFCHSCTGCEANLADQHCQSGRICGACPGNSPLLMGGEGRRARIRTSGSRPLSAAVGTRHGTSSGNRRRTFDRNGLRSSRHNDVDSPTRVTKAATKPSVRVSCFR
jgi:hypothetical protein